MSQKYVDHLKDKVLNDVIELGHDGLDYLRRSLLGDRAAEFEKKKPSDNKVSVDRAPDSQSPHPDQTKVICPEVGKSREGKSTKPLEDSPTTF